MMHDAILKYRDPIYDLSCSEATLYAANEAYDLGLDEKALRLMAGFSGGMMTEQLCGVVSAGVAVLSALFNEGVAHQSPLLKRVVAAYMEEVDQYFNSTQCRDIKISHRDLVKDTCTPVIVDNALLLDRIIKEHRH